MLLVILGNNTALPIPTLCHFAKTHFTAAYSPVSCVVQPQTVSTQQPTPVHPVTPAPLPGPWTEQLHWTVEPSHRRGVNPQVYAVTPPLAVLHLVQALSALTPVLPYHRP